LTLWFIGCCWNKGIEDELLDLGYLGCRVFGCGREKNYGCGCRDEIEILKINEK
jgi:hypothetical protein